MPPGNTSISPSHPVAANLARGAIDAGGEHLLSGDAAEIEIVVGNMDRFGLRSGGAEGETGGGEGSEGCFHGSISWFAADPIN